MESDVALTVPDRDQGGCIAVSGQVEAGIPEGNGVVDLEGFLLARRVRGFLGGHFGGVVDGLAGFARRFAVEPGLELVQLHRVRLERTALEVGARRELVVAHQGVDEGIAFHQDPLAAVPVQATNGHGHQHPDQGGVEHQVAHFLQEAALGTQGRQGAVDVPDLHPVAAFLQQPGGIVDGFRRRDPGVGGQGQSAVFRQARKAFGGCAALRLHGLVMGDGTRSDAADQRDEQQDVDGREPGRRVDVVELQASRSSP